MKIKFTALSKCIYIVSCLKVFLLSILWSAEPFVSGSLQGQLGNQFFIIAATMNIALEQHIEAVFPDLISRQEYNIPTNYKKIFNHLMANLPDDNKIQYYYQEPYFHYKPIPYQPNMQIVGWFQSEKYFKKYKKEIVELFSPSDEIREYLLNKYAHIIHHPSTVSIHIRSYEKEDPAHRVYVPCQKEYLEKAIKLFPKDALFVVFSNDMERCKQLLASFSVPLLFIEGEEYYHDFYLMSMCKHNIICNSTFSWWAAYLNTNPEKKVVAPGKWFCPTYHATTKDLFPSEWIIID